MKNSDKTRDDIDSVRLDVELGSSYDDYDRAYSFGVEVASRHPGRTFEEVEPQMSQQWNDVRGESAMRWESARNAVRDAWKRINGPL